MSHTPTTTFDRNAVIFGVVESGFHNLNELYAEQPTNYDTDPHWLFVYPDGEWLINASEHPELGLNVVAFARVRHYAEMVDLQNALCSSEAR